MKKIFIFIFIFYSSLAFAGLQINPVTGKLDKTGSGGSSNPATAAGWTTDSSTKTTTTYNVGVGSVNPTQSLDVNGTVRATSFIAGTGSAIITGDSNGNVGINNASPSQKLDVTGTIKATAFVGDGSGLTGVSGGVSGWTLGVSNVGISTTNNVGIGSSSPMFSLAIDAGANSNILIGKNTAHTSYNIVSLSGSSTDAAEIGLIGGDSTDKNLYVSAGAGDVVVRTNSTNDRIHVTLAGNVGIGSASPGSKLDIFGQTRIVGANFLVFGNDNRVSIRDTAATNGSLQFVSGNSNTMTLSDGANVGIGSTAPGQVLDIGGVSSKLRMKSPDGTSWNCQPANTTGTFTCT